MALLEKLIIIIMQHITYLSYFTQSRRHGSLASCFVAEIMRTVLALPLEWEIELAGRRRLGWRPYSMGAWGGKNERNFSSWLWNRTLTTYLAEIVYSRVVSIGTGCGLYMEVVGCVRAV